MQRYTFFFNNAKLKKMFLNMFSKNIVFSWLKKFKTVIRV